GVPGPWSPRPPPPGVGGRAAERIGIEPGDRVMRTKYLFREAGEPMMLSTSWEPLALTGRTPVMLPEEGPLGGMGVVERMRAIDVIVDNVTEEVGARPGLAEELVLLGGVPGHVVLVIQRTYYASGRPVETADVVIPADRYRAAYHLPVR
ncbi:UTRA domain-containing protein, partial [Streptomyces sp. NPDC059515]|uniref:UTRA domain-containing protein n=1 Tax=Streptomyces sp. NPDC059515 TaxID=3346854 RepID=UPI0036998188